jgi:hypothetical protein
LCYAKITPVLLHCGDCAHLARKAGNRPDTDPMSELQARRKPSKQARLA